MEVVVGLKVDAKTDQARREVESFAEDTKRRIRDLQKDVQKYAEMGAVLPTAKGEGKGVIEAALPGMGARIEREAQAVRQSLQGRASAELEAQVKAYEQAKQRLLPQAQAAFTRAGLSIADSPV